MALHCDICNLSYENPAQYAVHLGTCQMNMNLPGNTTIDNSDDDHIVFSPLHKPALLLEEDHTNTVNTKTPSSKLTTHPYLQSIGLAYNSEARILICIHCQTPLLQKQVRNHLSTKHKTSKIGLSVSALDAACLELSIAHTFPAKPTNIRAPFVGVQIEDGFHCPACSYCCISRSGMSHHFADEHSELEKPAGWKSVQIQTFQGGSKTDYFEVVAPTGDSSLPSPNWEIQILNEAKEFRKSNMITSILPNERQISPWNLTTGWHKEVLDHDIQSLRTLVKHPSAKEFPNLSLGINNYFHHAVELIDRTPELVLQRLNTPHPEATGITNQPLTRHQQEATTNKEYASIVTALVASLLRQHSTYKFYKPGDLKQALEHLKKTLNQANNPGTSTALHTVFLQLWLHEFDSTMSSTETNPTIQFLALNSINDKNVLGDAKGVTGPIAKLERAIRLVCLTEIHQKQPTSSKQDAVAVTLSKWFTEKHSTTFNHLRSLTHRASSISYSSVSMPRIWWSDREQYTEMLYQGSKITFKDLCRAIRDLEQKAVEIWENEILQGLKLAVPSGNLVDDLTNTASGWSFLDDPRNVGLQNKELLLTAILQSDSHKNAFFTLKNGQAMWNTDALRKWLHHYARFELILMTRVEFLGGAPGRGTELCSLNFRNTSYRPTRNLVVMGKYIGLLRQYHKSGGLTGKDKFIPHALDAVTGDLILQNLAIARPFACLAAHICDPSNVMAAEVYQNRLFCHTFKEFSSSDLSDCMGAYSLARTGFKITLNPWRHINIAWRRKLCPVAHGLLEEDDAQFESIEALQSGHSRQTENRIYGLSPDSFSGAAEDIIPLYLDVSTDWHVKTGTVPGGLSLPYSQARSCDFYDFVASGLIPKHKVFKSVSTSRAKSATSTDTLLQQVISQLAENHDIVTDRLDKLTTESAHAKQEIKELKGRVRTLIDLFGQSQPLSTNHTTRPSVSATSPVLPYPYANTESQPRRRRASSSHSIQPPAIPEENYDSDPLEYATPPSERSKEDKPIASQDQTPVLQLSPQTRVELNFDQLSDDELQLYERHAEPTFTEPIEVIQSLLGDPNADWTCREQEQALAAVLALEKDVLVLMKTGSGKSMLVMVPPLMETDITIAVFPLKSLITDYIRKLDAADIPFEFFTSTTTRLTGHTNLILVSVDMAKGSRWKEAVAILNETRKFVRLIFDEGHAIITGNEYRPSLRHVYELRLFPMQVVVLTGTCPPTAEPVLIKEFGLSNPVIIRTDSNRPELKYTVTNPHNGDLDIVDTVHNTLVLASKNQPEEARYLVFVPKLALGEKVAKYLQVEFFNGDKKLSNEDRVKIQANWRAGIHKTMVCTSAFGAGNDYSAVRAVIHAGTPFDMMDYLQESGRAGRDHLPAVCYIIPSRTAKPVIAADDQDLKGRQAMHNYIFYRPSAHPQACLRYQLSLYNDGKGIHCWSDIQNVKCLPCSKLDAPPQQTKEKPKLSKPKLNVFVKEPTLKSGHKDDESSPRKRRRSSTVSKIPMAKPPTSSAISAKLAANFGSATDSAKRRKIDLQLDNIAFYDDMLRLLNYFKGFCIMCIVRSSDQKRAKHNLAWCPNLEQGEFNYLSTCRQLVRYNGDSINIQVCWFCHVPLGHERLHGVPVKAGQRDCEFRDVMFPVVWNIFTNRELQEEASKIAGTKWKDAEAYCTWLGTTPRSGQRSHITELFCWYCKKINI